MEKLSMCRICLAENVRMYVVVNRNLHELYEKLTDIPFVTEDRRPMVACFFCCAKLKQCYRLLRQCLKAEELFAQMMNGDYEPNPLINQDHLEFSCGFIKSPILNISIVDECQTESIPIKEELPAVGEKLDDIIEPKEEPARDELELENFDNSCLDVAEIPPHHSESDFEDDVPLMEFKTEVEEEISENKRKASETKRTTVAKKPKLNTRRRKLEDAITAEHTKKEKLDSKVIRTTHKCTSKPDTDLKEHTRTQVGEKSTCDVCQRSFSQKGYLRNHICTHTGEQPFKCDACRNCCSIKGDLKKPIPVHITEKPYKCDICHRCFSAKGTLINHIRIHTGDKPYKCDVCQRGFSEKSNLTQHVRIHTGEKPYKCDVCQRCFSKMGSLINHIRIHTGDKPYKCDECQSSFSEKGSLTKHIRSHTGEKSFKIVFRKQNRNIRN